MRSLTPALLTGAALRLGIVNVRDPFHGGLEERFTPRRFFRVRAEAYDAAFAELAAGDCGRTFHDAGRCVVFSHFAFEDGERLIIFDVVLAESSETWSPRTSS